MNFTKHHALVLIKAIHSWQDVYCTLMLDEKIRARAQLDAGEFVLLAQTVESLQCKAVDNTEMQNLLSWAKSLNESFDKKQQTEPVSMRRGMFERSLKPLLSALEVHVDLLIDRSVGLSTDRWHEHVLLVSAASELLGWLQQ